jgi:hypothetical protein
MKSLLNYPLRDSRYLTYSPTHWTPNGLTLVTYQLSGILTLIAEKRLLEDYLRFLVVIASDRTKAGLSETALLRYFILIKEFKLNYLV